MRLRAVRALLAEELGGLPRGASDGESPEETADRERAALARASRRSLLVAGLDLAAVAVLFAFRPGPGFLAAGATEEGVFTFGVLLVTAHAGYRLAQHLQLKTVLRLHQELVERDGPSEG
jgi:hypothetical protein